MLVLKIFSLLNFESKSPNINFIRCLGKPALVPHEKCFFCIITFLLTWYVHFQNNDFTPATSQNYTRHPIANRFLAADTILCAQTFLFPIDDIRFLFHKKLKSSARTVPTLSHVSSCTLTKFNSLAAFVSELDLYRHVTVHVWSFMSLFHCVSRTKG